MTGRPLRLLQLVHGYPPAVGGVEFAVRDICEGLVLRGFEVTVFTTDAYTTANFQDGSLPTVPIVADEEANGVRIHRFPVVTRWSPLLRVVQGVAWRLRLPGNDRLRTWFHGPLSPLMLRAVKDFQADVICAASFPLNHMFYPFRRRRRVPVVLIGAVHTEWAWGYDRPALLDLISHSFATVAFTEPEKAWLVARGAPAERIRVIPLGIEPDAHHTTPGRFRASHGMSASDFVVAYVGQQGAHKGIDTLIRALPALLEAIPSARLVVAGSTTPYSATLRSLAATLPPAALARLTLINELDEQDKVDLLVDCDVFASPSAFESFGITTLEAWASSRPVVVGDGPSQRALVEEGQTGLFVPHGDERALLQALARLAGSPELRTRLGANGRAQLLKLYSKEAVIQSYHDLFRAAVLGRQTAG